MLLKSVFWVLLIHLELFILGSLFFILLFQTPLFSGVEVFFYRGILLLIVSSLLTLLLSLAIRFFSVNKLFTFRDVIISVTLVFCINLVIFTHLPVTAERSISVFLLSYMNKNSERFITEDEITNVFIQKYLIENKNIKKRFNEQVVTGNVEEVRGDFRITKRGMGIIKIYKFLGNLLSLDKKNMNFQ